jgi:endoglucanase Acf2
MKKTLIALSIVTLVLFFNACQKDDEKPLELKIESVSGLESIVISKGTYFNPLDGVEIINESNENIKHLLSIDGFVHYGQVGEYQLNYTLSYGDDMLEQTRTVEVLNTTPQAKTAQSFDAPNLNFGFANIRTGQASDLTHPVNPYFLDNDLKHLPVKSTSWWTSLLVANRGAGNGIYTNPYRLSFQQRGIEFTNADDGFVQYWKPDGFNTMANFSLAIKDAFVSTTTLQQNYESFITGYGDTHIEVALRNPGDHKDHMVALISQGSPFVYYQVADNQNAFIDLSAEGNSGYEFFSLDGQMISDSTYTGNGLVGKHTGYQTTFSGSVGNPIFEDVYMMLSLPEQSQITFQNNRLSLNLNTKNYFALSTIRGLDDTALLRSRFDFLPYDSKVTFEVDENTSLVHTIYHNTYLNTMDSDLKPIIYTLAHHQKYLDSANYLNMSLQTVRGMLKLIESDTFKTTIPFHGIVPSLPISSDSSYQNVQKTYLANLDDFADISDEEGLMNDPGPYWNGKILYPLTQSLMIADQINSPLKSSYIEKLKYILEDWFTYEGTNDDKHLYYNSAWKSTYYSDNTFNTASELSDHSFTHGYIVYASVILSLYDKEFKENYADVIDFFLKDYLNEDRNDPHHVYLRGFDSYAGHTWAHGFGTFAEGNNMESSSEAIQSWVAGYLWSLQKGDQSLRDASIYGFVHEVASAKMYMFDYDNIIFPDKYDEYADVAGMIWGGKYDYATWFGANPTFIYGIQWLPNGEYLTSYALNPTEKQTLTKIYQTYLGSKNQLIDTWFSNMWTIQAIINPSLALSQFDEDKILSDDYPAELAHTFGMIHSLNTYGSRTDSYIMTLHDTLSSSIYINASNEVYALIWNASGSKQTAEFIDSNGKTITVQVSSEPLKAYKLA